MGAEALKEVQKSCKIRWYRSPLDRTKLKELTARSDVKGGLQAGGHLLLIVATGVLTYVFFVHGIWFAFGVSLWVHGTIYSFLYGMATHELAHGTVFKTKWVGRVVLRLFSLLCWFNFHSYMKSHTCHHMYTLHPKCEREVTLPKAPSLHPLHLLQLFTLNLTGGYMSLGMLPTVGNTAKLALTGQFGKNVNPGGGTWMEELYENEEAEKRKAIQWSRVLLLFHLTIIGVSIRFSLWILPLLITFAPFIANWWHYLVGVPMHTGLKDNVSDFRLCVRTITLDPLSQFLYWNMNHHIEHHMFAAVPCYNLRKLHEEVAFDMPKARTLIGAWKEMRETWKRQRVDPTYQFETPLPQPKVV